jgi:hypothetical protein
LISVQDIFCYHNIKKGIKLFEYQLTDEILEEINRANYIAEAVLEAKTLGLGI